MRGTYDDEAGARALIAAAGGLPALLDGYACSAGLAAAEVPAIGDAGAVEVVTRRGAVTVGALCTGPRWAILTPGGLAIWPARPLAVWRV